MSNCPTTISECYSIAKEIWDTTANGHRTVSDCKLVWEMEHFSLLQQTAREKKSRVTALFGTDDLNEIKKAKAFLVREIQSYDKLEKWCRDIDRLEARMAIIQTKLMDYAQRRTLANARRKYEGVGAYYNIQKRG